MKKNFAILLLAALTCLSRDTRAEVQVADGIEAVIHDSVITSMEVQDATEPIADELRRDLRSQPQVLDRKYREALNENRERLVEDQLILREFSTAGYSLPESIIDEYVQERIKERYVSRATLTKTLAAQGITFEKWRKDIRDRFIIEQMRYANIAREIIVSPHKIETYYLEHTNDFKVSSLVRLRMILLAKPADDSGQTRQRADEVLKKIKDGAAFAEMATLYSQAADRNQGGLRNWEELSSLKKELADVAAKLEPGQMSEVIETDQACYIMKMEDKQASHVRPLNEVRAEIENTLAGEQRNRLQTQWIEKLRKKTFVRYF
jgi:peptidyl-prolyl cis-trans isomerase SurA